MSSKDWIENTFICKVCEDENGSSKVFKKREKALSHFEDQHLQDLQKQSLEGVI